jgi:Right handed beta helix region
MRHSRITAFGALLALAGLGCPPDPGRAADRARSSPPITTRHPEAGRTSAELPELLPPSTGRVYYVAPSGSDDGPGTLEAPWRSIQKAMSTLAPGELAQVRAGLYLTGHPFGTRQDTHTWSTRCSPSAPCSIVAFPGEKPVLRGQVALEGAYLRLSGFVIEGPLSRDAASPDERRANQVLVADASWVELSDNEIRHNDYHAGIKVDRSSHVHILNNYIHDNGRFGIERDPVTGNEVTETDHGIYWGSTSGGGNLVANNLIVRNRAKGLQFYPGDVADVVVVGNTIADNGNAGIIMNGRTDRITVIGNLVAYNGHDGKRQIRVQRGDGHRVEHNIAYSPVESLNGIENRTASVVRENRFEDPLFVDREEGNYRLREGSPAIDLGLPGFALARDLAHTDRPRGPRPDAGAFER